MLPKAHFATVYAKPAGRPLVDTYITEVSQDTWILFPWDIDLQYAPPIAGTRSKRGRAGAMKRFLALLLVSGALVAGTAQAQQASPAASKHPPTTGATWSPPPIRSPRKPGARCCAVAARAVDAAIATQMVLNLVEPESSGIGGGAFLVLYSAKDHRVTTFDGRETAPAAAKGDRFIGPDGKPMNYFQALVGGRSVGVPGVLRMLELAHRRYGKLPWASLFQPAIKLAQDGFPISEKLQWRAGARQALPERRRGARLFLSARRHGQAGRHDPQESRARRDADGDRETRRRCLLSRARSPTTSSLPPVNAWVNPSDMTIADIAGYQAKERPPICGFYRQYRLCGMGPPSSGGVAVLELLGLLQHFRSERSGQHARGVEPLSPRRAASPMPIATVTSAIRISFARRSPA